MFEDLDLSDFGNRIPALTFEVIADTAPLSVQTIVADLLADCDAAVPLPGLAGLTSAGSIAETLAVLDPVFPMDCDAGDRLIFAPERRQSAPIVAGAAAVSSQDGKFGGNHGFSRSRTNAADRPLAVLRYYDVARDYQPGVQRAPGRPAEGDPQTIELPAALDAHIARHLISQAAARGRAARETLSWRTADLDPGIVPGAAVSLPGLAGTWRVREWEWQSDGVELNLLRLPVGSAAATNWVDPGRANRPVDLPVTPTVLAAFELPWDGTSPASLMSLHAALSSSGAGWTGAALFAARGDGSLDPLGPSGRARSVMGTVETILPVASPLLFDRHAVLHITLIDPAMVLENASPQAMAAGANRALVGQELIQFARATPLGGGTWQLDGLLRGRGGTEGAIASHLIGEPFVLLDGPLVLLDSAVVGSAADGQIAALGLADVTPVLAPISNRGLTLHPLAPVHPKQRRGINGGIDLSWTRRARGAWLWLDHVDAALGEAAEAYQVSFGSAGSVSAQWQTAAPQLSLDAATVAALIAANPVGEFRIHQQGDHALSQPLLVALSV